MSRAAYAKKRRVGTESTKSVKFDLSHIFPFKEGIALGPFPKQRWVYEKIRSGEAMDGGIVYQGGKGCAKTICGAAAVIMVHNGMPGEDGLPMFQGCTSAVCRESYPALMTSTWDEFRQMLDRMPRDLIQMVREPSSNSMGIIEWALGGRTFFLSLSDERTWASMNLGLAWVDEGHLQNSKIVKKLSERCRQDRSPRLVLVTSNPAGRFYAWQWAHEKSKDRLPGWFMIESSMFENPALPKGYIDRMEAMYPPGTPGHRRWVLGQSAALEGTAFEGFYPEPSDVIHVIPVVHIPEEWPRGRGLDWGIDNPCVVQWAAKSPSGSFYVYRGHTRNGMPVSWHADQINELEKDENIVWTPADPEIFRAVHWPDGSTAPMSTAMQFRNNGTRLTRANNNRKLRLERYLELMTVDPEEIHPITLKKGAPHLYILDTVDNEELIDCLATIKWREAPKTGSSDSPDDVEKKNDHWYDALGYLVVEVPELPDRAPIRGRPAAARGTRGYRGYGGRR